MDTTQKCSQCGRGVGGATTSLLRCSRCRSVRYCSRQCQERHWPRHRGDCRERRPLGSSAGASAVSLPPTPTTTPPRATTTTTTTGAQWSNLFQTLYADPWQRARSRAEASFPGVRVSDDLRDLQLASPEINLHVMPLSPWTFFLPFTPVRPLLAEAHGECGVVVLVKLVTPANTPQGKGWIVEDKRGSKTRVFLAVDDRSVVASPDIRHEELQQGHILCLHKPVMGTVMMLGLTIHMLITLEPSKVRVIRD